MATAIAAGGPDTAGAAAGAGVGAGGGTVGRVGPVGRVTAVLSSAKRAGPAAPATVARAVHGPTDPPAVTTGAVAEPSGPDVTVAVDPPPGNVPLAPVAGRVNVTAWPGSAAPPQVTRATRGEAKAWPDGAACPAVCASMATGHGVAGSTVSGAVARAVAPLFVSVTSTVTS